MIELTEKERRVYDYILAFQEEQAQYPVGPTARQIETACGLSGPSNAHQIWTKLEKLGLLGRAPNRSAHQRFAIREGELEQEKKCSEILETLTQPIKDSTNA